MIKYLLLITMSFSANAGEQLAFLQYVNDYWQVFIKNEKQTNEQQLTFSEYDKTTISWNTNGDKIFVSGVQGEAEQYELNNKAVKKYQLPHNNVNDAVMSPNGAYIAYSAIANDSNDNKIWLYGTSSGKSRALHHKLAGRQHDPKWNDAGNNIYFVSGDALDFYDIRKIGIDDKYSKIVIANHAFNFDINVVDKKILYSSNRHNGYDIWMQQNKTQEKLTNESGAETHPAWSAKKQGFYYVKNINGVNNIWFKNIASNAKTEQITDSITGARLPVVYSGNKK